MFVLTPVSAVHSGYPSCPAYNYNRAAEAVVHRAAHDYAVARARAEAIRRQRAQEEERRFRQAVLREQAIRRAEVVGYIEAMYQQQYVDAERYRERLELEAARRRAELLRQRQQAEQARAVAAARQRLEAEHRREAALRQQEHWIALLASQFGPVPTRDVNEPATQTASAAPSKPKFEKPVAKSFESELLARLHAEQDPEVRETLQALMSDLGIAKPADKKGKARETPAIPFDLPKTAEHKDAYAKPTAPKTVHFSIPVKSAPSAPADTASTSSATGDEKTEGANLQRTPAMTPAQAQEAQEHLHTTQERKLSLGAIQRIEDSLRALRSSFVFPTDLDLAPTPSSSGWDSDSETDLAFTPKNKPVHIYEHALNGLLEKLDAVESYGDEEIRGRRKEVVREVEDALRDIGRNVERSREREKQAAQEQEPLPEGPQDVKEEVALQVPADVVANVESTKPEDDSATPIDAAVPEHPSEAPAGSPEVGTPPATGDVPPSEPQLVAKDVSHEDVVEVASSVEPTPATGTTDASPSEAPALADDALLSEALSLAAVAVTAPAPSTSVDTPIAEELATHTTSSPVADAEVSSVSPEDAPALESTVNYDPFALDTLAADASAPAPTSDAAAVDAPATTPSEPSADVEVTLASPTPSTDSEAFFMQSNPLPDPEPRKAGHQEEEDVEIIDAEDIAEEVLNEEWSDVESQVVEA